MNEDFKQFFLFSIFKIDWIFHFKNESEIHF